MSTLRLGVIGGCMTHQTSVPRSALFHRVLAKRLEEERGVRLDLRVVRAFSSRYTLRLALLCEEGPLDAVLLHVRPSVARKSGVVAIWKSDTHYRYFIHPFLFRRRGARWSELEEQGFRDAWGINRPAPPAAGPEADAGEELARAGLSLRDLPRLLGILIGLDRWAIEDEMHEVQAFLSACADRGVRPVILGPTPAVHSFLLDRMRKRLNARLRPVLATAGVPFLGFDGSHGPDGALLVRHDGRLNETGHRFVADMIHERLAAIGLVP